MRLAIALILVLTASGVLVDKFIFSDAPSEEHISTLTPVNQEEYLEGYAIYAKHCQICHGPRGDGNALEDASRISPKPTNFTTPEFSNKNREHIRKVISEGGKAVGMNPTMPKWKTILSDREIDLVSLFVSTVGEEGQIRGYPSTEIANYPTTSGRQ